MIAGERVLKGGSLNKTALLTMDDGRQLIRKSISLVEDREYGFVRWNSQMKRIQRYNKLFPGLFPELLDVGTEGDTAFLDIEYIADGVDLKLYLVDQAPGAEAIAGMHDALWAALDRMHEVKLDPNPASLGLYFKEEVERKLRDALADESFRAFAEAKEISFHDQPCKPLIRNLEAYAAAFRAARVEEECFTHGNVTLENVVYVPGEGRIVFIDPYDENIVDCPENEYSQVLQCCRNHYGFINDRKVVIEGERATFEEPVPEALTAFNGLFVGRLESRLSAERLALVRLFEISQFARMLPFKVAAGDIDKAKYFYAFASKLLDDTLTPT
ncbi:MAG: hypothetical protein ACPGOV_15965 [Magnetovibrionaceae bacterium]